MSFGKLRRHLSFSALTIAALLAADGSALRGQAPSVPAAPVGVRGRIDGQRMLADIAVLAHDSLEGRRTGTAGSEKARAFITRELEQRGIGPLGDLRTQSFEFSGRGASTPQRGVNVLGLVPGTVHADRYMVVTAHYDHLGVRNGQTYNGADDNASGTAAILALAEWIRDHPQRHSFLFVAFDAEEMGLQGARAFIARPPVPLDRVVMNVNLDMVSRSPKNELYAVGTYHYPFLGPFVEQAARPSKIKLLTGHQGPGLPPGDDWTGSSDHGAFHEARIPFLYLGVEDHPGYHQPSDDAADITPDFYVEAIETALDLLLLIDRNGELILESKGR